MNAKEKRAWEDVKKKGSCMFAPERGGQYAVFNERLLSPDIMTYCGQNVICMPNLWQVYSQMLPRSLLPEEGIDQWRRKNRTATKLRVIQAASASYNPYYSQAKVLASHWNTVVYDPDDS
jgi:exonuclease 3'-5' domain-containing protein 1